MSKSNKLKLKLERCFESEIKNKFIDQKKRKKINEEYSNDITVEKIDVREDRVGNVLAKDKNGNEIFIQRQDNIEDFFNNLMFDYRDEGFESENDMSKEDAIKEVSKGWTVTFQIGNEMWEEYLDAYEGRINESKYNNYLNEDEDEDEDQVDNKVEEPKEEPKEDFEDSNMEEEPENSTDDSSNEPDMPEELEKSLEDEDEDEGEYESNNEDMENESSNDSGDDEGIKNPFTKNHREAIRKWILSDKNLTDDDFHQLCDDMDISIDDAEQYIFKLTRVLLKKYIEDKKGE